MSIAKGCFLSFPFVKTGPVLETKELLFRVLQKAPAVRGLCLRLFVSLCFPIFLLLLQVLVLLVLVFVVIFLFVVVFTVFAFCDKVSLLVGFCKVSFRLVPLADSARVRGSVSKLVEEDPIPVVPVAEWGRVRGFRRRSVVCVLNFWSLFKASLYILAFFFVFFLGKGHFFCDEVAGALLWDERVN